MNISLYVGIDRFLKIKELPKDQRHIFNEKLRVYVDKLIEEYNNDSIIQ